MSSLNDTELEAIAAEVDAQLNALQSTNEAFSHLKGKPKSTGKLPSASKQQALIERATGEPFETFWEKFRREARRDLCLPGGKLHGYWQKWHDLDSKTAVGSVHGLLLGMGIAAHSVTPITIAATVILLNVVLNIGIKAICEDCD